MSIASTSVIQIIPRTRRGVELLLLVIAIAVSVGAYVNIGITVQNAVPASTGYYAAGIGLLALIAHLALRYRAPYADPVLLPCAVLLNGLGVAMIHRIDLGLAIVAEAKGKVPKAPAAPQQITWTAVGIVLFLVVILVIRDHRRLQALTYTAGLVGLLLLVLPLIPGLGVNLNGARIWIRLAGMSFQPGEFAKICLVVFFAGYLVVKRDVLTLAGHRFLGLDLPRARDLGPIGIAWAVSLGVLVFESDLGSSLLFFGLFLFLLYVSTERAGWLIIGGLLFVGGAYFAYMTFGHVHRRVTDWLNPWAIDGGQVKLGLMGQAWGGILGRGLGQGHPEATLYANSDMIISSFAEELGLTGLIAILLVYTLIIERGLRTALGCRDIFGKLIATGLAMSFALQVFVIVGGVTGLIPLTGLATPFMALGGTSLVANWAIIALLLRISDQARRPQTPAAPVSDETIAMAVQKA
ncbi:MULTISPECIES: FtsW/RodA/SpoVE family cell cycle protein [Kribbella]|jgi:cell division protein FtsW (lipid II flippase)|uniref:Cell elongation-specific peptidoglycan biosynthesis regulator RodA n=1 Tax=Kribbella pratensis TaxID=2512112 RepID=A0ABY2FEF1_9ACTN|nr:MULTISPECIES: FtsW/RodA/SpoVE family cell cycle protein [Kribbella]TDW89744.1 cell elongation-specific peptidoglycan biosynthesis regulator RodA [Kribbella pratensis]TDX08807.1 cell elongation-specific peptidoglycan biosynthesis regulator RodA [Kribbella sp. VKM Ac-2566]